MTESYITPATVVDTRVRISQTGKVYIQAELIPGWGDERLYAVMVIMDKTRWVWETTLQRALNEYEYFALGLSNPDLSTPDACFDLATQIANILVGKHVHVRVVRIKWRDKIRNDVRWV